MGKPRITVDLSDESEIKAPVFIEETHELSRDEVLEKIDKLEVYLTRAKKRIKTHEEKLKKLREKYEKDKDVLYQKLAKLQGRILEVEV